MHDLGAVQWDDTVVVDVYEIGEAPVLDIAPTPDPPTARTAEPDPGDLTMQVKLEDNRYHRRAIGGFFTACGKPLSGRLSQSLRHETYEGKLCEPWVNDNGQTVCCFSAFELELNAAKNRERREAAERENDAWFEARRISPRKDKP